ncbi:Transcriptional regulatory protein YpdB [Pelotomaculum schinkii]|uniref:Stage 0 sporulation protein A homolog n=1 Tax=Pelotomaculum schinkii TaxID=78350 RepID=A0A4Y7RAT7_9FIRM|nr:MULTISPECIES: LytTR family DNA-binding domain-containing protein [Pelotomaculum]TEB05790.1 Transcriptional regulatory protein YpdB [Pelotomaculum schinkii]TEB17957.1 Transcriptional regulatory protein YpdB [Pelotomaculum sp. FP]
MVSILLLEDEHYTRRFLKKLVSENPFVDQVIDTSSSQEAISLARQHKPSIVLLDIELAPEEELNGIQVAKNIYDFSSETYFVFITGYAQYAIESFAVHPYDYILKPVKKDRVNEVISSLADKVKRKQDAGSSPEKMMFKAGNEIFMIAPGEILFIEKRDKVSLIHTGGNVYRVQQTLGELEEKLGDNFSRVHRSFIVNLNKVSRIEEVSNRSYEIGFAGYGKTALMSRYKFKEYKHRFTPL